MQVLWRERGGGGGSEDVPGDRDRYVQDRRCLEHRGILAVPPEDRVQGGGEGAAGVAEEKGHLHAEPDRAAQEGDQE